MTRAGDERSRTVLPEEIRLRLSPSPDALLARVSPLVTDADLRSVASADYGHHKDDYFAALKRARDGGDVSAAARSCHNVLELTYLTVAENDATMAFCCALVLRTSSGDEEDNVVLACLVDSALALGDAFVADALALLGWILGQDLDPRCDGGRDFVAFGAAILAARLNAEESVVLGLLDQIETELAYLADGFLRVNRVGPWLLGSTLFTTNQSVWRRMAVAEFSRPRPSAPRVETALQERLRRLQEPWEDLVVDPGLLERSLRVDRFRLWLKEDAIVIVRFLGDRARSPERLRAVRVAAGRRGVVEDIDDRRLKMDLPNHGSKDHRAAVLARAEEFIERTAADPEVRIIICASR